MWCSSVRLNTSPAVLYVRPSVRPSRTKITVKSQNLNKTVDTKMRNNSFYYVPTMKLHVSIGSRSSTRFDCHHIRNTAYVYPKCHPALLLLYRIQSQVELPSVRVANPAAVILLLDRILLVHHTVHHTSWPVPSQFSSDAAILLVQYTT